MNRIKVKIIISDLEEFYLIRLFSFEQLEKNGNMYLALFSYSPNFILDYYLLQKAENN